VVIARLKHAGAGAGWRRAAQHPHGMVLSRQSGVAQPDANHDRARNSLSSAQLLPLRDFPGYFLPANGRSRSLKASLRPRSRLAFIQFFTASV
jgi:hypothetical protein